MAGTLTLTAPQGYRPGGAYGVCDRCGFKLRHADLRKEWTGLLVCQADWDPEPADLRAPYIYAEGLPIRDARPEPAILAIVVPPDPEPEAPAGGLDGSDDDAADFFFLGIV